MVDQALYISNVRTIIGVVFSEDISEPLYIWTYVSIDKYKGTTYSSSKSKYIIDLTPICLGSLAEISKVSGLTITKPSWTGNFNIDSDDASNNAYDSENLAIEVEIAVGNIKAEVIQSNGTVLDLQCIAALEFMSQVYYNNSALSDDDGLIGTSTAITAVKYYPTSTNHYLELECSFNDNPLYDKIIWDYLGDFNQSTASTTNVKALDIQYLYSYKDSKSDLWFARGDNTVPKLNVNLDVYSLVNWDIIHHSSSYKLPVTFRYPANWTRNKFYKSDAIAWLTTSGSFWVGIKFCPNPVDTITAANSMMIGFINTSSIETYPDWLACTVTSKESLGSSFTWYSKKQLKSKVIMLRLALSNWRINLQMLIATAINLLLVL